MVALRGLVPNLKRLISRLLFNNSYQVPQMQGIIVEYYPKINAQY